MRAADFRALSFSSPSFVTPAIANLSRTGELQQIYSMMQTGNADGMLLLEQSLANLYHFGMISRDDAIRMSRDVAIFESRLRRLQERQGNLQPA